MFINAEEKLKDLHGLNERGGPVFKIRNDPRVTKVGRFIRNTYIDELPQLINVIKGQMSLVGPRPPIPSEVEQYTPHQMMRLSIKPGLTCYWQISNKDMTFEEWVALDLRYIHERSFLLDIKIICRTVVFVLRQFGEECKRSGLWHGTIETGHN
jgi:lipopolysaccharide/colanic/teichoic acid biosynthesis glycosyltransferase